MPLRRFALNLAVLIFVVLASESHRYGEATWYVISMWVMTFLVLALMLYNQGIDAYRKRKRNRRLASLYALMSKGQDLERTAPGVRANEQITAWHDSVKQWAKDTSEALAAYSPQAAAAFNQYSGAPENYRHVHSSIVTTYDALLRRLDSLKEVMENPDVYY